jgi:hypothetical protein
LAWFGKFWQSCVWLSWYLYEIHPKDIIQCHPNTKTPKFLRPRCAKYFKANNFKRKSDIPQPLMQDSVASPRLSAGYGRFPAQRQVWQLCYRTFNMFQYLSTSSTPPSTSKVVLSFCYAAQWGIPTFELFWALALCPPFFWLFLDVLYGGLWINTGKPCALQPQTFPTVSYKQLETGIGNKGLYR